MRVSVSLPTFAAEDPGDWQRVFDLARAADAAGIDRVVVSDHVVFGENLDAYARPEIGGVEGGRQPTGPDGHWLEPIVVLTAVAAQTTRVRVGTYILIAALRRPVVLAKQLATLDVLSQGRVDLGVGIGWQREEYEAAGLDFGARGHLLDHSLAVCRTFWQQQRAAFASPELTFDAIHAMPKPVQPGGVPIWVSGRVNERVAQRLARFGSGWIPWGDDATDLAASLPRLREAVDRAGGEGGSLSVLAPLVPRKTSDGALDSAAVADDLGALAELGVTDVLAQARPPRSADAAGELYAGLVAARDAATTR
jgi:probable F420-dependent oxidoreductase